MKHFFICFLIILPFLAKAQDDSIGISVGYTTNGIGVLLSYNKSINDNSYIQVGGYYSIAEDQSNDNVKVPYNDMSLNIGYFHNIITSLEREFHFAIGGGGIAGYEIINGGNSEIREGIIVDGENQFIYGAFVGLEAGYYFSDHFSVSATVNEYYHIGSDLGKAVFYGGLGVKYHIF